MRLDHLKETFHIIRQTSYDLEICWIIQTECGENLKSKHLGEINMCGVHINEHEIGSFQGKLYILRQTCYDLETYRIIQSVEKISKANIGRD